VPLPSPGENRRAKAGCLASPQPLEARAGRSPASRKEVTSMRRALAALRDDEQGMSTAEYAVGTVAACGFGGVLYKILTSDQVMSLLTKIIEKALTLVF